jgi:hypothetical protein
MANQTQVVINELQIGTIYKQVIGNPYLKLFYQIMIERNVKKVFEEYAQGTTVINLFDFVALAAKYLSREDFETTIKLKIQTSMA